MKWGAGLFAAFAALACSGLAQAAASPPTPEQFRRFALTHEGDPARGGALFADEQRLGCTRCHSIDGKANKAGPDLCAVGDKFGRREIIDAVVTPSASIAEGYSATTIETKSGDEITGIVKQASDSALVLQIADGTLVTVPRKEVQEQRTSDVSFMPEGLQDALDLQEFTDLIDYLVTLKQPDNYQLTYHGMPRVIPPLSQAVQFEPFPNASVHFEHPVWFGQVPAEAGVFLVVEHESGRVWRLDSRAQAESQQGGKTIFLETGVFARGTRGLLGLAFHPKFRENRLYYIVKHTVNNGKFASLVWEREASPDLQTDSGKPPRLVLQLDAVTNVHYGGSLVFGPDGYLYVGMGDTGPQEDPHGNGQNVQLLLGKILRIDVDHRDDNKAYSVPSDNPFVGRRDFRPEIWAYGFREPWRFSFDPVTGDLWVGDVGQDRYEEVDLVRAGENYGWNVYEGFEPFSNQYRRQGESYVAPVFAYRRPFGPSVTGGYVYRADPRSSFYGVYVCGDYESRRIFGLTQENRQLKVVRQIGTAPQRVVSFGRDEAGAIYVVGYEGGLFRLNFSGCNFN